MTNPDRVDALEDRVQRHEDHINELYQMVAALMEHAPEGARLDAATSISRCFACGSPDADHRPLYTWMGGGLARGNPFTDDEREKNVAACSECVPHGRVVVRLLEDVDDALHADRVVEAAMGSFAEPPVFVVDDMTAREALRDAGHRVVTGVDG